MAIRSRFADYVELTRPRIALLVLFTVAVGFWLASAGVPDLARLLQTLVGTALMVAGASALNQVFERHSDARMGRTANRPLPAGRLARCTSRGLAKPECNGLTRIGDDGMNTEVLMDADAVARKGAEVIASEARAAVAARGRFSLAVSGGHTPWEMLRILAGAEVPWQGVHVFQVDERVAPTRHPDRNLTSLMTLTLGLVVALLLWRSARGLRAPPGAGYA